LQALVAVVHTKQTRMVAQVVVHPVRLVRLVPRVAVEVEHKLQVALHHLMQPLALHCKVEALLPAVMAVVVVVAVVVIGAAVAVQVPTLVLQVAVGLDT
jgi:hypothetical protein